MEKTEKKKINIPTIAGMIVGAMAILFVQHYFFSPPSFDKVMMQAASEINKTCPIMVDQETRLDNTMALTKNVFQYNYTLVNMEKGTADIDQLQNYLKPTLVNNTKSNPNTKIYRDNKTTLVYQYKDKNGVFLFQILITPDLYAN